MNRDRQSEMIHRNAWWNGFLIGMIAMILLFIIILVTNDTLQ